MTNLFKKAHEMANQIKKEFPDVDYKLQFALCVKYLGKDMTMDLAGSEKQIKWAMSIREDLLNSLDAKTMASVIAPIIRKGDTQRKVDFMNNMKSKLTKDVETNNNIIVSMLKDIILSEQSAEAFIDNRAIGLFLNNYFNK